MTNVDWSKAPEWATVALQYYSNQSVFFAESFNVGSRICHSDRKREVTIVDKHGFKVLQHRPNEWGGVGLPPVGVRCMVSPDGGHTWCQYLALKEQNGKRLVEISDFSEDFQNNNLIFKPLE